jgi:hypothetical protein
MKLHKLKLETKYYQDVISGKKTFEIRKNDRNFQIGDYVEFTEVVYANDPLEIETGRVSDQYMITYIFDGGQGVQFGLSNGFCVLQIKEA